MDERSRALALVGSESGAEQVSRIVGLHPRIQIPNAVVAEIGCQSEPVTNIPGDCSRSAHRVKRPVVDVEEARKRRRHSARWDNKAALKVGADIGEASKY